MRNVSSDFLRAMDERTDFYFTAKIEFKNGQVQSLQRKDFNISGNSLVSSPESNSFPLGVVVSKKVNLSLRNDDERWSYYDFNMAKITVTLNLDLDDGRTEMLNMGVFTVTAPESYGSTVEVVAVDDGYKLDKDYSTLLEYPMTIGEAVRDSCRTCGVSLLTSTFHNSNFLIHEKPSNLTHRKFVGLCAMIAGGNGIFDENNRFSIVEYDFTNFEGMSGLDGGIFDDTGLSSYQTGDAADGGTFKPWNTGYEYADGNFADLKDIHVLYKFKSGLTVETDDVVITGIKIVEDEKEYLFGKEGYVLQVENQLIAGSEAEAVRLIGERIVGLQFRPFTGDLISYPLAEFMDLAYIVDGRDRVHKTVLTDIDFSLYGFTVLKCSADSPIRNSSKYYGNEVKAVIEARKETEKQLSAYDIAVQNMNQLAANTMGFYATTVKQADGSILAYRHDKPKLSESKIVYKSGIDGFWVTEDYRGTDVATTWKAGFDSNGNAVLNMLSVIGINFDWAHGGTLTLGGVNNQNGVLRMLNAHGNEIGAIDKEGVSLFDYRKGIKITIEKDFILFESGCIIGEDGQIILEERGKLFPGSEYYYPDPNMGDMNAFIVETPDSFLVQNNENEINFSIIKTTTNEKFITLFNETNIENDLYVSGTIYGLVADTEIVPEQTKMDNIAYHTMGVNQVSAPTVSDIGTGTIDQKGYCYIYMSDIFTNMVSNCAEYQVFLQKEGAGDLWVDSKESTFFTVKGTPNLKFSWEIKAVQKDHEYEYFDEKGIRNKVVAENDDLHAIFADDLRRYDEEVEVLSRYENQESVRYNFAGRRTSDINDL